MNGFVTYIKNVRAELKHVVWPNPRTAVWHTLLIAVVCGLVGGYIALLDYGFTNLVTRFIGY